MTLEGYGSKGDHRLYCRNIAIYTLLQLQHYNAKFCSNPANLLQKKDLPLLKPACGAPPIQVNRNGLCIPYANADGWMKDKETDGTPLLYEYCNGIMCAWHDTAAAAVGYQRFSRLHITPTSNLLLIYTTLVWLNPPKFKLGPLFNNLLTLPPGFAR